MKIGAHSWLLETRYPLPQAMAQARRIGYDGYEVDIGNFGGSGLGLQILPDRMQDEQREEIRRSAAEADIEISSLCMGALWHYPFTSPDEAIRKRGVEIVQAAIPLARTLGARCILLPIDQPTGLSDKEAWHMTVRSLVECLPIAEEAGVVLAVENNVRPFLERAAQLGRLVDELASAAFRIYYDVGNGTWIGLDPAAEILELGDRIAQFHIKNRSSPRHAGDGRGVGKRSRHRAVRARVRRDPQDRLRRVPGRGGTDARQGRGQDRARQLVSYSRVDRGRVVTKVSERPRPLMTLNRTDRPEALRFNGVCRGTNSTPYLLYHAY